MRNFAEYVRAASSNESLEGEDPEVKLPEVRCPLSTSAEMTYQLQCCFGVNKRLDEVTHYFSSDPKAFKLISRRAVIRAMSSASPWRD